jgi:hypothetical protein
MRTGPPRTSGTPRPEVTVMAPAEISGAGDPLLPHQRHIVAWLPIPKLQTRQHTRPTRVLGCATVLVLLSGNTNMSTVRARPCVLALADTS